MRILTTTEYNEVCKSYEHFGSKLFDEMFLGYDGDFVSYLYNEIIKDHKFRYGKFDPIPYPLINNQTNEIKPKKDTE